MKTKHWLCMGAIASAVCVTGSAFAADASVTMTQTRSVPSTTAAAPNRVPANPYAPVPQWSDYDVPTNFPTRNLSLPPRTGSDVIPDYMGPGSIRGQ